MRAVPAMLVFLVCLANTQNVTAQELPSLPRAPRYDTAPPDRYPVPSARDAERVGPVRSARTEPVRPQSIPASTLSVAARGGLDLVLPSGFDTALGIAGFRAAPVGWSADLSVTGRVADWLWLGARVGCRARSWARDDARAGAFSAGALVLARGAWAVGPDLELAVELGAGVGHAGIGVRDASTSHASLRLAAALTGSVIVRWPWLVTARIGWDVDTVFGADLAGHDLDLGGGSLVLGLELRS